MSQVFPLKSAVELDDEREPRLVELDEDTADEVFDALASETTRQVFAALHDEPQTASDLADVTDTTVQNAKYHLDKLCAADLVEPVDTWYSERGTEMKVYAPTDESLVLFAGERRGSRLRSLLKRALGAVGLLGIVSLLVALVADRMVQWSPSPEPTFTTTGGDVAAGDGGSKVAPSAADGAVEASKGAAEAAGTLDPAVLAGLACFVGGLFVLSMVGAAWYWIQRTEKMAAQA